MCAARHEWLLSDAVDILPFLLLPLAGPEELTEEENEGVFLTVNSFGEIECFLFGRITRGGWSIGAPGHAS